MEMEQKINQIDQRIMQLFEERIHLEREICPQERVQIERRSAMRYADGEPKDMQGYMRMLYRSMQDIANADTLLFGGGQSGLKTSIESALMDGGDAFPGTGIVACQGAEGAYSQIACDRLFEAADILYFKSFEGVVQAVDGGLCPFGLLPMENSLNGSVGAIYDLMQRYDFSIVRSIRLPINHCLMALPGTKLSDIKTITSHQQAIGQSSKFLDALGAEIVIAENTAVAAKQVAASGRRDLAAICSPACAKLYGLCVLKDDVQNEAYNLTRFILIQKKLTVYEGADRISLLCQTPHEPGALYRLISRFAALGVNLTKLESRPIPGRDFEFMFYFDLETRLTPAVTALLGEMEKRGEIVSFLGHYRQL